MKRSGAASIAVLAATQELSRSVEEPPLPDSSSSDSSSSDLDGQNLIYEIWEVTAELEKIGEPHIGPAAARVDVFEELDEYLDGLGTPLFPNTTNLLAEHYGDTTGMDPCYDMYWWNLSAGGTWSIPTNVNDAVLITDVPGTTPTQRIGTIQVPAPATGMRTLFMIVHWK